VLSGISIAFLLKKILIVQPLQEVIVACFLSHSTSARAAVSGRILKVHWNEHLSLQEGRD
jgi:hypothetical protein